MTVAIDRPLYSTSTLSSISLFSCLFIYSFLVHTQSLIATPALSLSRILSKVATETHLLPISPYPTNPHTHTLTQFLVLPICNVRTDNI